MATQEQRAAGRVPVALTPDLFREAATHLRQTADVYDAAAKAMASGDAVALGAALTLLDRVAPAAGRAIRATQEQMQALTQQFRDMTRALSD